MSNKNAGGVAGKAKSVAAPDDQGDRDWRAFVDKVGKALATERKRLGLSQQAVAEKIGIEPESISRIENGAIAPTLARLRQFAQVYGCSMESLVGTASDQSPDIAGRIASKLEELSEADRAFVAEQTMNLIGHIQMSRQRKN